MLVGDVLGFDGLDALNAAHKRGMARGKKKGKGVFAPPGLSRRPAPPPGHARKAGKKRGFDNSSSIF